MTPAPTTPGPDDRAAPPSLASSQGQTGAGEPALPPLSILTLDDDDDFRDYLTSELEKDGHDVRACATPPQFYKAVEERMPDVVLLDMKMGPYQGHEVLEQIRKRWEKLCVIVVTGYPSMDSMRQTFKQDVFDYIPKPFSPAELRRSLSQAVTALGLGQRPQDRLRMELGRQVRLARIQRGWTLKQLSDASDVSVSQLSSIERGTHLPSLESLVAIAQALGRKPSLWLDAAGL